MTWFQDLMKQEFHDLLINIDLMRRKSCFIKFELHCIKRNKQAPMWIWKEYFGILLGLEWIA